MKQETPQWFVATTRPRAERKVAKRLTDLSIENLVPMHRKLRTWSDRKQYVEMPLFTSYVFIHTTELLRKMAFEAEGLLNFVAIRGVPATLRAEEIERIKKLCCYEGEINIVGQGLQAGDEVTVISGVLSGMRGKMISEAGTYKIKIALEGLGSFALVDIEKEMLRKI